MISRNVARGLAAAGCTLASIAAVAALRLPLVQFDERLYDTAVRRHAHAARPDIVMIGIDPQSRAKIDAPACNFNSRYAAVVNAVSAAGATAIGLDVIEPRAFMSLEDETADLAEALASAEKRGVGVVLAAQAVRADVESGVGVFEHVEESVPLAGHAEGLANLSLDFDDVVRRQELEFPSAEGRTWPSFDLALLAKLRGVKPETLFKSFPVARSGGMWIDFAGPAGTIPNVPLATVLDEVARKDTAALSAQFSKKIVLVGEWDPYGGDAHVTPWTLRKDPSHPPMPGLEVHANVLGTMLDGNPLRAAPFPWIAGWLVLVCAVVATVAVRSGIGGTSVAFGAIVLSCGASVAGFEAGYAVPLTAPCAGALLALATAVGARARILLRREQEIRELFGTFLAPVVVDRLLERDKAVLEAGEERVVTVMFTDIRGFTRASENRTPTEVLRWLRRYHTAMAETVDAHGGYVDKFVGDGVVALFGAPLAAERDGAMDATRCALAMVRRLDDLNEEFARDGLPRTKVGIGIHTGNVIVGVFGADSKHEYTALGDTVNIAARIEGETKKGLEEPTSPGGKPIFGAIVMSEDTVQRLRGTPLERAIGLIAAGEVVVRGRTAGVMLYGVNGDDTEDAADAGADSTAGAGGSNARGSDQNARRAR